MMSPIKQQLIDIVGVLPETEQALLLEIAKRFVSDDVATDDDLQAISLARAEYFAGETVGHSDINWD